MPTAPIRVLKLNLAGQVTWQYEGRVLRHGPQAVTLEAYFNRDDMQLVDVVLKRGDRFVETFYADRWYNVFEIYDRDTGGLKGWYCNVSRPALIDDATVSYVDLALDLWASTDGRQTVLDEDEFEALSLDRQERDRALGALAELKTLFKKKRPPS